MIYAFFQINSLVNLKLGEGLYPKLSNINSMYVCLKFCCDMKNFNIHHLNKIKDQYNANCKIINTMFWIQFI